MTNRDNILNELSLLNSTLGQLNPENLYKVPNGYFWGLSEVILMRIKAMNTENPTEEINYISPVLADISRILPYSVPAGYFEGLEEKIVGHIRKSSDYQTPLEELESISPLLGRLKKQNPFTVPAGYFDSVSERKPVTKVISFSSRKWFRYAAAAIVIGIVSIAAILFIAEKNTKPADENKAWAKIENNVNKLSDKEIKDFVALSDAGSIVGEAAGLQPVKKEEVSELLLDVSDSDLKEFLKQISDDVDDISILN